MPLTDPGRQDGSQAVYRRREVDMLSAAIRFYTATEATVVEEGGFRFLMADGYRADPSGP